jgi:hypothetical protein
VLVGAAAPEVHVTPPPGFGNSAALSALSAAMRALTSVASAVIRAFVSAVSAA